MPETRWKTAACTAALGPGEVDVWRIALRVPETVLARYAAVLSEGERARAARFHFERDHRRYVTARGTLRVLLAQYEHTDPADVRFSYNGFGKPFLARHGTDIAFNLSHARDLALVAVTRGRDVGVDVEDTGREVDVEALSQRFFCTREAEEILALDGEAQRTAFFNGWTRKEAFLKARGAGVTLGLNTFEVSVRPGEPPRLYRVGGLAAEAARWTLYALDAGRPFVAALAVTGHPNELRCWQWAHRPG